jgi:hypothetical protein
MLDNIYLLEQAMKREMAQRAVAAAQLEQVRAVQQGEAAEPKAAPVAPRILLRVGPLVLSWTTG